MRRLTFCTAVLLTLTASAQPRRLTVDGGPSRLGFDAKTTFHPFNGRASRISGELILDQGKPVRGTISCGSASLVTASDGRDRDMHGPKYLDVEHFPGIVFTFSSLDGPAVPASGRASGTLHGTLQVRSQTVPVAVPITYGWDGEHLDVTGSFPLDIRAVGLVPPVIALIQRMSPEVRIGFALQFH